MKITITVGDININVHGITDKAENDPAFWTFAAKEWHRLYNDYVPMSPGGGNLYTMVHFAPKEIEHFAPYAHYQYEGIVYGPNIPIMEGNRATGYFSMPNRKKKPTGKRLQYDQSQHPKATAKWDKAAAPTQGPKLAKAMQEYIDQGRLKFD